jgi:hypothetical protein
LKFMTEKILKTIVAAALISLLALPGHTQESDTLRVLFVGNSFTFYWNLPQVVQAMAETQQFPLRSAQSTASGASWAHHWKGERGLDSKARIQSGKWDIVVLQNHSTSAIDDTAAFREYGAKFAALIRETGATPLLFQTWAYDSNPLQQPAITKGYTALARSLGSSYVPVGEIWDKARFLRPDLELYSDDKHPSPDATYLIALAFLKALSGQSVLSVPERLTSLDSFGEKLYLSIVSAENAAFFKQLVEEFPFPQTKGLPKKN